MDVVLDRDEFDGVQAPGAGLTYRIRLSTAEDARKELARIYREARTGTLPLEYATKLTYILTQLVRILEVTRVERRLDAMEAVLAKQGITYVPEP